jgi:hypothetical protein
MHHHLENVYIHSTTTIADRETFFPSKLISSPLYRPTLTGFTSYAMKVSTLLASAGLAANVACLTAPPYYDTDSTQPDLGGNADTALMGFRPFRYKLSGTAKSADASSRLFGGSGNANGSWGRQRKPPLRPSQAPSEMELARVIRECGYGYDPASENLRLST